MYVKKYFARMCICTCELSIHSYVNVSFLLLCRCELLLPYVAVFDYICDGTDVLDTFTRAQNNRTRCRQIHTTKPSPGHWQKLTTIVFIDGGSSLHDRWHWTAVIRRPRACNQEGHKIKRIQLMHEYLANCGSTSDTYLVTL